MCQGKVTTHDTAILLFPTFSSQFQCFRPPSQAVTTSVQPNEIAGIGFDATCSLVVLDEDGAPLSVSHEKNDHRNVIMW